VSSEKEEEKRVEEK
jgi:hypothetical protein